MTSIRSLSYSLMYPLPSSKNTLVVNFQKYLGRIYFLSTIGKILSKQNGGYFANDFALLFNPCEKAPSAILDQISEKLLKGQTLYMSSLEHCYLALMDAELVSKEQVAHIFQAGRGRAHNLARAFFGDSSTYLQSLIESENWAIRVERDNEIILRDESRAQSLALASILKNIGEFIRKNPCIEDSKDPDHVIDILRNSQYGEWVYSYLSASNKLSSFERTMGLKLAMEKGNLPLLQQLALEGDTSPQIRAKVIQWFRSARRMDLGNPLIQQVSRCQEIGQRILAAGQKYLHTLQWMPSSETYITRMGNYEYANDFVLLYKNPDSVPPPVLARVSEKFQQNTSLMCCWEFCFLALLGAQIVTEKEVEKIYASSNKNQEESTLLRAVYDDALTSYPTLAEASPQPGDLLIYSEDDTFYPRHAAIYAGMNVVLELGSDRVKYIDVGGNKAKIYLIYAEVIRQNILNFLQRNPPDVRAAPDRRSTANILLNTSYRDLALSYLNLQKS